jgi:pyridoxine 5'-phosphate synthase PdxJ
MAHLQTKLTSFITSLATANLERPSLYSTTSSSSFASDSSCDSPDTELQAWKYGCARRDNEQDEVKRKRSELAEKRRRASDAAWREFWP